MIRSNESSNSKQFQRTMSAQHTLDEATALLAATEVFSDTYYKQNVVNVVWFLVRAIFWKQNGLIPGSQRFKVPRRWMWYGRALLLNCKLFFIVSECVYPWRWWLFRFMNRNNCIVVEFYLFIILQRWLKALHVYEVALFMNLWKFSGNTSRYGENYFLLATHAAR